MSKSATGIKAIASGRTDTFSVDPKRLQIKQGWNSRDFNDPDNIEHVDMLARSIAKEGVKEPLTIFFEDGIPYVNNGECRLRGAMRAIEVYKAEVFTVPVRLEDRYANDADRVLNQLIRNSGKPFSPMELSNHFKRLLGAGLNPTQISERTGFTPGRVSQILNLQTLPEPVKEMVTKQQVSATTAAKVVAEQGGSEAEKQLKAGLEKAQSEGKSKVTAKHLPPTEPPKADLTAPQKSVHMKTALKEAFDKATIDNSEEDIVVVTFPDVAFEVVRELLDL